MDQSVQQVDQNVIVPDAVVNPAIPAPTVNTTKVETIKVTSFFSFIFKFIILGISSIAKYGTNAFNPNTLIDNSNDLDDSKSTSLTKKEEKIELKKQSIRTSPKYIEMKNILAKQLAAEAGQKYEETVVFQYTAMNKKVR